MLTTQSENFQKFKFEFLAGIVSNTWQTKIRENQVTVSFAVLVRLDPVAMLVEAFVVDPSSLCPDPSREKWREEKERAQDPPSLSFLFLHNTDRCARADPQHSVAEAKPLQHARKAAMPDVARRMLPGPPHR
jgi:hypothetical protein